jgi:hypothetical protein
VQQVLLGGEVHVRQFPQDARPVHVPDLLIDPQDRQVALAPDVEARVVGSFRELRGVLDQLQVGDLARLDQLVAQERAVVGGRIAQVLFLPGVLVGAGGPQLVQPLPPRQRIGLAELPDLLDQPLLDRVQDGHPVHARVQLPGPRGLEQLVEVGAFPVVRGPEAKAVPPEQRRRVHGFEQLAALGVERELIAIRVAALGPEELGVGGAGDDLPPAVEGEHECGDLVLVDHRRLGVLDRHRVEDLRPGLAVVDELPRGGQVGRGEVAVANALHRPLDAAVGVDVRPAHPPALLGQGERAGVVEPVHLVGQKIIEHAVHDRRASRV